MSNGTATQFPGWEQPLANAEIAVAQRLGLGPQASAGQNSQTPPAQPQQPDAVPVMGPDQQVRFIPTAQVGSAMAAGGKQVTRMLDPQGAVRFVPNDQVEAARANGGIPTSAVAPYSDAYSRFTSQQNYNQWVRTPPATGPYAKPGEYEAWTGAHTPGGPMETLQNSATTVAYGGIAAGTALTGTAAAPAILAYGSTALANPIVQQGLKMAGQHIVRGALTGLGMGAAYKFLKSIGIVGGQTPSPSVP